jgi:hypothetical protein
VEQEQAAQANLRASSRLARIDPSRLVFAPRVGQQRAHRAPALG